MINDSVLDSADIRKTYSYTTTEFREGRMSQALVLEILRGDVREESHKT